MLKYSDFFSGFWFIFLIHVILVYLKGIKEFLKTHLLINFVFLSFTIPIPAPIMDIPAESNQRRSQGEKTVH